MLGCNVKSSDCLIGDWTIQNIDFAERDTTRLDGAAKAILMVGLIGSTISFDVEEKYSQIVEGETYESGTYNFDNKRNLLELIPMKTEKETYKVDCKKERLLLTGETATVKLTKEAN